MRRKKIVDKKESNCQTSEFKNFCIRNYVTGIRERDPEKCWPFESVCDFKNLKIAENAVISPELTQDETFKGKAVESENPTEIITSKELNDEIISDGATNLVNLSESENEESVNEENTDSSDEDFTIDDEDDSNDDTLDIFLTKQKSVKVPSRSTVSRTYKKKIRAPKPLNRGPKGSKARTTCAKPPHPRGKFATRKLTDVVDAEVAVAAKRKRCGSYEMESGTQVCVINRNPADFTVMGRGNKYMKR
ncbi:hypothetical protein LXL04_032131 [Taraxacum kok-saghyz]